MGSLSLPRDVPETDPSTEEHDAFERVAGARDVSCVFSYPFFRALVCGELVSATPYGREGPAHREAQSF